MNVKSTKEMTSLLFVCLGNICRSPAAEGVMKHKVSQAGISDRFFIDSAGIGGWHAGELPDIRMRTHALQRGYLLESKARKFVVSDFMQFDYIIVMDDDNYKNICAYASSDEERAKVLKMKDFFSKYKGRTSVPDPYYGTDKDFELAIDLIEDGCSGILERL